MDHLFTQIVRVMRPSDVLAQRQSAAEGRIVPDFFDLPPDTVIVATLDGTQAAAITVTVHGISAGAAATEALSFTTDETIRGYTAFESIDLFTIATGIDGNPAGWLTVKMINTDEEPLFHEEEVEDRLHCRICRPQQNREVTGPGVETIRTTERILLCKATGNIQSADFIYIDGLKTYEVLTAELMPGALTSHHKRAELRALR